MGNKIYDGAEQITPDLDEFNILVENDPASLVRVKASSDFGVIDSTKVYLIDGVIDMTGVSIEIPAGGINLVGYTFDVSQLVSADNTYTMFRLAVVAMF